MAISFKTVVYQDMFESVKQAFEDQYNAKIHILESKGDQIELNIICDYAGNENQFLVDCVETLQKVLG